MKIGYVILAFTLALFGSCYPAEPRGCVDIERERVFADVPFDHPLCVEIESMWRDGLTTGCRIEDGVRYFCPGENLTRGMAAMFTEHRDPFAQIDREGRIVIGDHVASAERYSEGVYWVQFTRDIQRCSTEGWSQDRRGPGVEVDVSRLWGTIDTVVVETTNNSFPLDLKFNVRLHCR